MRSWMGARLLRPLALALSVTLSASLSGCFMHTAEPLLDTRAQDVEGLAGQYVDDDGLALRISRIGRGLYRFRSAETPIEEEAVAEMRAMSGDCSEIDDADARADCARSTEEICAEEKDAEERRECAWMLGALRGEIDLASLTPREAALAESLMSAAQGWPHRDDVVFAVAPLSPDGRWIAAQVLVTASFGKFADFAIFEPQLLPHDIVILGREDGGWTAFATQSCVVDADSDLPLSPEAALSDLEACPAALAAAPGSRRLRLTRQPDAAQ